jgi:transposase-like protein
MTSTNGVVDAVPADRRTRPVPPDPEVPERARRRQFTAAYKLRILEEAAACSASGQVGALLRREGLYSSHLVDWRRQRAAGTLAALAPRRRGRPADPVSSAELARLKHENERLSRQLAAAEAIIEIQKKVSALLGLTQPSDDAGRRS